MEMKGAKNFKNSAFEKNLTQFRTGKPVNVLLNILKEMV